MSGLTERIPVLLTPDQRERLARLARREGRSVGAVIREAIDAYTAPRRRSRREALDELYSLDAPVTDWPQMKAEIVAGATGESSEDTRRRLRAAGQSGQ